MTDESPRKLYLRRWEALKSERNSWLTHWQDVCDYCAPSRGRFFTSDRNLGNKRSSKIINNTASKALQTLAAGMMAGVTSPARPWFKLTTPDADLADFGPVKAWLHAVETAMLRAFARSNIYKTLHSAYLDLGAVGTAAVLVEDDEQGVRSYLLAPGRYALAAGSRGEVNAVYREFSFTVAQVVERFGLESCSRKTRERYERHDLDGWVEVLHVVQPNAAYLEGKLGPAGKEWKSCWLELAADEGTGLLRESGFEEFPYMVPRWQATSEDVYGWSPAMDALGDVKALQTYERHKAALTHKLSEPPMTGPMSLQNRRASLLPGDITYVDVPHAGAAFRPAIEVNPAGIQAVELSIREHERRINSTLYADLWLLVANRQDPNKTAREVAELHEEKMLQLGPVLESLHDELLDPLIDRTFGLLLRAGQLPPPPEELAGQDLRVEYISILAQAQKMLGVSSVERLVGFVGQLAAVRPDVLDGVDFDAATRTYAEMLGTPPDLVLSSETVAAIRQQRAEQQRAEQAAQAAMTAAQGAKTLSEAKTDEDNGLTRLLGMLSPSAATAGGGGL